MSNLYTNVLDPARTGVWEKLVAVPVPGVLGGGTAIALQLGHRISYDFDIFLTEPVPGNLPLKIKNIFPDASIQIRIDSNDELTLSLDGIKVTYLYYPFPALYPNQATESLPLFDLKDSAANKAYTIGRRGAWRDYFDLYTICTATHATLEAVITDAEKKFGDLFSAKLFLEQLTYAGDITDFAIEPLGAPVSPKDILSYFEEQAQQLIKDRG